MTTSLAFANWLSSRFAAGKGRRTQSSFFICTPWNSMSSFTRRAMVTGAYARRNSSIAAGIMSGFSTKRRRSTELVARCHNEEPIPLHVVSIPAINNKMTEPATWRGDSFSPKISAFSKNEMRSSRGFSMWSLTWNSRYSLNSMNCCMRASVRSSPTPLRTRFTHPRNLSPSSTGKPSMRAITMTGMCCEYCNAASM